MYYYKSTIQYDGTNYAGFQWQKDIPTIQNEINMAIKKIIPGKITTLGASRTDTGVHAQEQLIKITSENMINSDSFQVNLNKNFPSQIRCLDFQKCSGNFNPISCAASKEYRYFFTNNKLISPMKHRFISNFPYLLNSDIMMSCAEELSGEHNFHNFCSTGSNVKQTVRNINFCELSLVDPQVIFEGSELFKITSEIKECYQLRIVGNGFLKQMVRHIVSVLWMVGSNKLSTLNFTDLINGHKQNKRIWKVAPPNGLFLFKINYKNENIL